MTRMALSDTALLRRQGITSEFPLFSLYVGRISNVRMRNAMLKTLSGLIIVVPFFVTFQARALAQAPERPTLPDSCEDQTLTQGKTAREFFQARAADAACQKELQESKARYHALKKAGQDDEAEKERDVLLAAMEKCGECASHELETRNIRTPGRTEHWAITDGFCQLPESSPTVLAPAFERVSDSLLHVKRYPRKLGGLDDILELIAVDNETGKPLPDYDKMESPFFSFIAIHGPQFVPGIPTAITFYSKNTYQKSDTELHLKLSPEKTPEGFQPPDVYLDKQSAQQLKLTNAMASWHVTSQGCIRYYCAGDFPMDMKFAAKVARRIFLNTLVQVSERAIPEVQ